VRFQSERNLTPDWPFTVVLRPACRPNFKENPMNGVIYLVGLIVVVLFILSLLGLR
jgi:hypothetical protein